MQRILLAVTMTVLGLIGFPASGESLPDANSKLLPRQDSKLEIEIQKSFANLPERKALKIWAPATKDSPALLVEVNGQVRLFSASANKAVILCERLRQLDSPNVAERILSHELKLGRDVWSPGSPVFNPPDLSGIVSERTAMEAMVTHSDNTATDMVLEAAGANRVKQFIETIGLMKTMIPDSTRALAGYLLGAPDYKTITWEELQTLLGKPFSNPPLNDLETLASSANDLVSFYSRSLQGVFFENPQTLDEFRRLLLLGDITHLVPFPLGINVFGKAGYFDSPGHHARCVAGGMFLSNRWVYFAAMLNWDTAQVEDPGTVEAFFGALRKTIALIPGGLGS
jgi:beta-lactamase class A